MRLKQSPYHLLLVTAIFLFLAAVFITDKTADIHLHDTYYVLPVSYLIWFPTILLVIFWLFYVITKGILFSQRLAWLHILFTVVLSLFIVALPYSGTYIAHGMQPTGQGYNNPSVINRYNIFGNWTETIVLAYFLLLLAQLAYFINLFGGLYYRVRR